MAQKNRIQGITIEIGGDTTGLDKALKGVNSTIGKSKSELRDVEKLLKLDPTNTELLSQKQKLLKDAIGATKDKLDTLKQAQEEAKKQLENGELGQDKYDALQREIIETEEQLKKLETQARNSTTALMSIEQAGQKMQEVGGKISAVGQELTTKVTAPIVALGTAAVKTTADFDESMSKVAAVSGATGDEFDALRDKAREMGSKTKFSASEAADAMNYMAMAGWKTTDMIDGIDGIMNLAAASGEDLATTSDIVTDALTAFGEKSDQAGRLANIMAAASSNANTNVSLMGETFKYAAAVAGSYGYSMEDTAVSIGLMANAGIKGSQAGTAMRSIMSRLATDAGASSKSLGALGTLTEKLGVQFYNADGSMRDWNDVISEARVAWQGLTQEEQANYANTIAGKNAMSGWLALMNAAPEDIEKLETAVATCNDEIDGANGAAEHMANVMQDNLNGQLTILKSALEELAISIGDILMPTIRKIVEKVQQFVNWLNNLDGKTKETVVRIALLVAAIGPLLLVMGGVVKKVGDAMTGFVGLVRHFKKVTAAVKTGSGLFGKLGGALGGVSGAFLAIVAVIGVLVGAFVHLWKNNEQFRTRMTEIWEHLKEVVANFVERFKRDISKLWVAMQPVLNKLKEAWDKFCNALAPVFVFAFETISNVINLASRVIHRVITAITQMFEGDFLGAIHTIGDIFAQVWEFICVTFNNAKVALLRIANTICSWFGTDWETVWNNVSTFISGIWGNIAGFFTGAWDKIKAVWEPVAEFFTKLWEKLHQDEQLGQILDAIAAPFQTAWEIISGIWGAVTGFFTTIWSAINGDATLGEVLDAVSAPLVGAWEAIQAIWDPVIEYFTGIWNSIHEDETLGAIADVVAAPFQLAWTAISTVWDTVAAVFTGIWGLITGDETLATVLDSLKQPFLDAWDSIKAIWDTVADAFSTIWTTITTNETLVAIATTISGFFTEAWTTITGAWDAASGYFSGLWTAISEDEVLGGIAEGISGFFTSAWTTISGVWDSVQQYFTDIWTAVTGDATLEELVNVVTKPFTDAWTTISTTWDTVTQYFSDLWTGITENETLVGIGETISGFITGAWDTITGFFTGEIDISTWFTTNVWDKITGAFSGALTWANNLSTEIWGGITGYFTELGEGIGTWFTENVWDKITGVFSGVTDFFKGIAGNIWDGLTGGLSETVEDVKEKVSGFFESVWGGVLDFFGIHSPSTLAKDAAGNVIDGFTEGAEDKQESAGTKLKNVFSGIYDAAKGVWDKVTGWLGKLFGWGDSEDKESKNAETKASQAAGAVATGVQTAFTDVETSISGPIEAGAEAGKTAFTGLKTAGDTAATGIKTSFKTLLTALQTEVQTGWTNISTKTTSAWTLIQTTLSAKLSAIAANIKTSWSQAQTTTTTSITSMRTSVTSGFVSIQQAVQSSMSNLASNISNTMSNAVRTVQNAMNSIRNSTNFQWNLPYLKMPHIWINGWWSMDPPSAPSFSVHWYKDAMENGMILDNPTIFGMMNGKLLGAGDAGAEAVVGLHSLMSMIQNAVANMVNVPSVTNVGGVTINVFGAPGQDINELADVIEERVTLNIRRSRAGGLA